MHLIFLFDLCAVVHSDHEILTVFKLLLLSFVLLITFAKGAKSIRSFYPSLQRNEFWSFLFFTISAAAIPFSTNRVFHLKGGLPLAHRREALSEW